MNQNFLFCLIFSLCILGACAVFVISSFNSITALGKNPAAAPRIFTVFVIALVVVQILAISAMLAVFYLFGNK